MTVLPGHLLSGRVHLADERYSRHGAQGWLPRVEIYILGLAVCGETAF